MKVYLDVGLWIEWQMAIYGSQVSRDRIKASNHNNGRERKNLDSDGGLLSLSKAIWEDCFLFSIIVVCISLAFKSN